MNGRLSNAQTPRPHPEPQALQEKLLDVVESTGAGKYVYMSGEMLFFSLGAGRPQSPREQSPVSGGLVLDEPLRSTKRRLDTTCETHPLPATKRARLEETEAQQPRVEDEGSEQAAEVYSRFLTSVNRLLMKKLVQTTLQQPKPEPPERPYASFLEDCVYQVDPSQTVISEWLESVGSDRDKHCRSDSQLHRSDDGPISRKPTRSAPPGMAYIRDADGFAVPPTPSSCAGSAVPSDLTGGTGSGRSSRSLVEDPLYRDMNLAANNIYMRSSREQFPEHIVDLIDYVRQDRDSPGPSPDKVWQDRALEELGMGSAEPDVEKYFQTRIFPDCDPGDILKRSDRQPMAKHTVPSTGSKLKVSNPVPDMLYGYNRQNAFPHQQAQLISMGTEMVANNQGLLYPFFAIEFKGDGPSGSGSLWVATNQCLGGSASCVNIAERLNHQLRHCKSNKVERVSSAAFSLAMSGTEARLYISWRQNELDTYMANVDSFLLQKPKDYREFRKHVLNIVGWGKDKRLNEIRDSLDTLLEESRKRASEAAKSHQPPSDGSATSRGKRHKSSSSRRNSRSDSVQGQSRGEDESYWDWDETAGRWFHTNADGTVTWTEQEGHPSSVASAEVIPL
jgi:hypothetical protein